MAQVDQKQKWPFSRDVNMREHLIRGYLENGMSTQTKGNPAATPSTLMDFGFWDTRQSLPTPIGKALLENKISWSECVTWVLSKRPSSRDENNIKVVNLNSPDKALLMDCTGDVLETSMNDIEIDIVLDYYHRNKKYMEVQYA